MTFKDYLMNKRSKNEKELEPYYEKLKDRDEAGMNLYGAASPNNHSLIDENNNIDKLLKKLVTQPLDKIKYDIEKDIERLSNTDKINHVKALLKIYPEDYRFQHELSVLMKSDEIENLKKELKLIQEYEDYISEEKNTSQTERKR